jgi:phenylacetate-CoA ligase
MTDAVDEGIRWTVEHAYQGSAFFRDLLDQHGVDLGSVRGRADLPALPFTTKEQLRAEYPLGWTAVPHEQVARVHASSGTTGRRTVCSYTERDVDDWIDQFARCYELAGVGPNDRVQVMVGYGLWTAGWGFQAGAERRGAMAVPVGPGNTELQLEMMRDLGSTVLGATSSFALLLGEHLAASGGADDLALRVGIFGAERWGEAMRRRIESTLGIDTFDIYGLTELYGPGMGIECEAHDGIHWWSDYYVIEIVDPETLDPVPDGVEGEIVLTTLRKEATPLIRYRTRDLSRMLPGPCACGRPYPRMARLTGRTDDMVKVRGVAVFPSQIDSVLSSLDGVGSEYQLHVRRDDAGRDEALVRIEALLVEEQQRAGLAAEVQHALRDGLGVRFDVELVGIGELPRSERKTQRVFDTRA